MKLRPRERKLVVAAALAALFFVLLEFVVLPRWDRAENSTGSLFLAKKELRRSRELIAAKQLREQETALRGRLSEQEHRLLIAPDANQAGAQLQTWLASRAAEQQLGLIRSEFLAPSPAGDNFVRIPVRLELNGRITQLTQFFSAIVTGDRIVDIEELQINGAGDKDKQIHCGIVVAALMEKPQ